MKPPPENHVVGIDKSWLAKVFGRNPYLFRGAAVVSELESWIESMTVASQSYTVVRRDTKKSCQEEM